LINNNNLVISDKSKSDRSWRLIWTYLEINAENRTNLNYLIVMTPANLAFKFSDYKKTNDAKKT